MLVLRTPGLELRPWREGDVAFTVPANRRSRAVMERLGMSRDLSGDFEHPRLPPGHPLRHHVLYRLTALHWRASIPAYGSTMSVISGSL